MFVDKIDIFHEYYKHDNVSFKPRGKIENDRGYQE